MKMGNFGTDITGNFGQKVEFKYFLSSYIVKKKLWIEISYLKKIVLNKLFESFSFCKLSAATKHGDTVGTNCSWD